MIVPLEQLDPEDAQAHYQLGLASLKQGKPQNLQEAFRAFAQAVQLDPGNIDAQLKLGEFYLLAREFDQAQDKAELVLKHDPDQIEAHLLLSKAYAGQNELSQASTVLQTALTFDPKRTRIYEDGWLAGRAS